MGLSENQKRLIQSISQNDIMAAKKCAVACVTEDTTSKNHLFCSKYKQILESSGSNMMELPYELKISCALKMFQVRLKRADTFFLLEKAMFLKTLFG